MAGPRDRVICRAAWASRSIQVRCATSFSILAALLGLFTAATGQVVPPNEIAVSPKASLQDAAVELARRYDSFYRQKDAAGMASLYAADGELVSPGGEVIRGRDALKAYYRRRFASGASGHRITVLEPHGLGDSGISISDYSVSAPTAGQPSASHLERGHIAAVYAHDRTGWHFALVQPSVTPEVGG